MAKIESQIKGMNENELKSLIAYIDEDISNIDPGRDDYWEVYAGCLENKNLALECLLALRTKF